MSLFNFSLFKKAIVNKEKGTIQVLDPEIRSKLDKLRLSPSTVNQWLASPGDFIMSKFFEEAIQSEPTPHLIRGNWFHSIMEDFYKLPPYLRNKNSLKSTTVNVTKNKKDKDENYIYRFLLDDEENKEWIRKALSGFERNGWLEQAREEKVAELFVQGQNKLGLELYLVKDLPNISRKVGGFMDQLIESEHGLIIRDWKTGSSIKDFDPTKPISDKNDFDYWRQQLMYAILCEAEGLKVAGACLMFPMGKNTDPSQNIVIVDTENKELKQVVLDELAQVSKEIDECITNEYTFPFKEGKYNAWAYYLCQMGSFKRVYNVQDDLLLALIDIE